MLTAESLQRSGALRLVQRWTERRPSLQILIYHRVSDDQDPYLPAMPTAVFRTQARMLAEHFLVMPLVEAVDALTRGELRHSAVAITFDDGYRDNYEHAWPILRQHGLAATIFLSTGVIGSRELLWHDRVFAAFARTQLPVLREFGPDAGDYPMAADSQKSAARHAVLAWLRTLGAEGRAAQVRRLQERLEVDEPPPARPLMLGWSEIREMASGGIGFGSHTVTHPILSCAAPEAVEREVVDSKREIERHLGGTVASFAYPNGTRADFDDSTKEILRGAGYRVAVTTIPGLHRDGGADLDPLELRRSGAWESNPALFGLRLCAARLAS